MNYGAANREYSNPGSHTHTGLIPVARKDAGVIAKSFAICFFLLLNSCHIELFNPFLEDTYRRPGPTTQVALPDMAPPGGTYSSDRSVAITCATTDAVIRYTTNGTDPNGSSPAYSAAIPVSGNGTNMTIKAYAAKAGMKDSAIRTETYVINYDQVSTPVMSKASGTYESDQGISITCDTIGATIHYTINGPDPDGGSPVYSTPVSVAGHGTVAAIKAIAILGGMTNSTIRTETYTIQYPTITSITSSTPNGVYGMSASVNVTATFSEAVTLAGGTLEITLDTGAVVSIAPFGPAVSAACAYTLASGEASADLDSTGVSLAGGTLRDTAGNDVYIALPATTISDGSAITVDCVKPVITSFTLTSGSPATSHFIAFSLAGSDTCTGITHWLVSESASVPAANDPGWVAVKPGTYRTSEGYGIKTVYAWAKDGASNVSLAGSNLSVEIQYIGSPGGTSFEKNTAGDDNIKGAVIDYDDNLYVVGNKWNGTDYDWSIIKLAPNMAEDTVLWNKQIDWYGDDDCIQAAVVDSGNNLYVAGWFTRSAGNEEWGIRKYSSSGAAGWTVEWNYGTGIDDAQAMAIDSNDDIYVAGYVTIGTGNYAWCMKKYDHATGTEIPWIGANGVVDFGTGYDTAVSMARDSSNNIYVVGRVATASNGYDWMMRKYDASGNAISPWPMQYDRSGENDQAYAVNVDSNNNVYVTGYTTKSSDIDWTIRKYGPTGTLSWSTNVDNGTDDVAWGIGTTSDGYVWVGGRLLFADNDWTVIKMNPSGGEVSRDVITNTGADWCRAIVVDSQNYVYGVGGIVRSGTGADWFIKRYAP